MSSNDIESAFPGLASSGYSITSDDSSLYNCIAWAAEDQTAFWWPDPQMQYYWPIGVRREVSVDAFVEAYQTLGYLPCDDNTLERGFEKHSQHGSAPDIQMCDRNRTI